MQQLDVINILKEKDLLIDYDEKNLEFLYLSYYSKDIEKNTLFFCKGFKDNFKEDFLKEAIERGAVCYISEKEFNVGIPKIIVKDSKKALALISELFYDDKNYEKTIIGITGTKGKTTVLKFLSGILDEFTGRQNPYFSTIDYFTGKKYSEADRTTPESLNLYKGIKDMQDEGLKYLTLEVTSQAAKLDRVYNVVFDYGLFLNIGNDHISPYEHKDFDEYINCKISFLKQCKTVIIYKQTDHYDYIISELKGLDIKIYTYGTTPDCDFYVSGNEKDQTFYVEYNDIKEKFYVNMLGEFNILNAAAAISVAKLLNAPYEKIKDGLIKTKVPGRMDISYPKKCPIVVDYAHNKLSIKSVFDVIKEKFPEAKLKIVFGCPGERGYNRRYDFVEVFGEYNGYCYVTEDDPHSENLQDIINEVEGNCIKLNVPYEIILDRETAIKKAYSDATEENVIVCLGKGHEKSQIRLHERHDFYIGDSGVVEEIMKAESNEI